MAATPHEGPCSQEQVDTRAIDAILNEASAAHHHHHQAATAFAKRCREVFVYSDEDEEGEAMRYSGEEPPEAKQEEGEAAAAPDGPPTEPPPPPPPAQSEWIEDLVPAAVAARPTLRTRTVAADNGFQATQRQFHAALEEQAKQRPAYRCWLEREDFLRRTAALSPTGSPAEEEALDAEEEEEEEASGMEPVLDDAGHVKAVVTRGGYVLSVDESVFVDETAAAVSEERLAGDREGSTDRPPNLLAALEEADADAAEEEEEALDEEEEEAQMDALVTVAVTQQLVSCFQADTAETELEPELRAAGKSFMALVCPLLQQRERLLRAAVQGRPPPAPLPLPLPAPGPSEPAWTPCSDVNTSAEAEAEAPAPSAGTAGTAQAKETQEAYVHRTLTALLPLALDDDAVFANAVDAPLRRVLRAFRQVHRPPREENIVIDGVVMDL